MVVMFADFVTENVMEAVGCLGVALWSIYLREAKKGVKLGLAIILQALKTFKSILGNIL